MHYPVTGFDGMRTALHYLGLHILGNYFAKLYNFFTSANFSVTLHQYQSNICKMKNFLSGAWMWSRRYITLPLIIAVAYIVFVLFFNENSYFKSVEYQAEIDRLEAEIKENNDSMNYYRRLNASLTASSEELERIVREQYHMQRPNEDVYVFEKSK